MDKRKIISPIYKPRQKTKDIIKNCKELIIRMYRYNKDKRIKTLQKKLKEKYSFDISYLTIRKIIYNHALKGNKINQYIYPKNKK